MPCRSQTICVCVCAAVVCTAALCPASTFDDARFRERCAVERNGLKDQNDWEEGLSRLLAQSSNTGQPFNRAAYCYLLRDRIRQQYRGLLPRLPFDRLREGTALADSLWQSHPDSRELLALRASYASIEEGRKLARWAQAVWPPVREAIAGRERKGWGRQLIFAFQRFFVNMLDNQQLQKNPSFTNPARK